VTASLSTPNKEQKAEIEELIVEKYNLAMTEKNCHKLLAIPDVKLIAVEKEHCIRLCFLCSTLEARQTLCRLLESVQLKESFEELFNSLLTDDIQFKPVYLIHLSPISYCSSMDYFPNGRNKV